MSNLNLGNRRGSNAGRADYSPIRFRGQSNQLAPVSQIPKEEHHNVVSTVKRRIVAPREEVELEQQIDQVNKRYRNP